MVYCLNIEYVYSISFSDTLFKDDVSRLVAAHSGKSRKDLSIFLRDHLKNTYPTEYWVVTVYDDVTGYDKHAYRGIRIGSKFRHHGVNYVVTRFPKYIARSPSVPISEVVGSVSGSDPKAIRDSIKSKFDTRGQGYSSIHVVKRRYTTGSWIFRRTVGITLWSAWYIPGNNFFWKQFSDVFVIVVAPRYWRATPLKAPFTTTKYI